MRATSGNENKKRKDEVDIKMTEGFRKQLPVIVAVSLVGIVTGAFALVRVLDAAASMNVETFSSLVFVIPCAIMLICSLVVAITAHSIGRQLYVTMLGICLVTGVVSMVLTSIWMSDASLAASLLANSPEGSSVVPVSDQPLLVMRNIAAYVVMPTVGCIVGAWLGSRLHPVQSEKGSRATRNAKSSNNAKKRR